MALISGQYYRGNPKQKPKQWGSALDVNTILLDRINEFGVSPLNLIHALPIWQAGDQIDYIDGIWSNNGASFENNALKTTNYIYKAYNRAAFSSQQQFTIFIKIKELYGAQSSKGIFSWVDSGAVDSSPFILLSRKDSGTIRWFNTSYLNDMYVQDNVSFSSAFTASGNNSAGTIKTYLNGELQQTKSQALSTYGANTLYIGSGYNGVATGYYDGFLLFDTELSSNQIKDIDNNFYSLFQPPTFRTYFDLAEAGTTLSFTSINSNSDLNNNFLSAIRLLNPTNISCFTEISDSIISGLVNIINGNDLLADSQITKASVQAIRKLLGQEISSLSQITDIVISTAKQFNLTDLNSLTEVTNVVFSVIHQINNNDLLSNSQVINLAIDVIRQININSIESISDITEVVLSITGGIRGIDVEAQTEITSLALSILRVLKENNVESNSSVNEATLNVIHQLDFNNISSLSEITDIVTVAGSNIGINDNSSLTQITQVILDIIKAVSPININIQSEIDNPVINVLRTLFSNTVNVISNVTSVGVTNISTIATGKVTITFSMAVPSISWSLE